ncbi:spore coat polysaccharide biosynthesis protein [[Clostridium] sordellii]|uniref:GNAT family N-acetyltransferase n=1 Tax=Paraclostridium sordellii TaxID=1505 RepID=UPI0005E30850|nr:GNAT family N-acetyltransferase [Paeniclostridium sordellii]CEP50679.1 spore coat polysaccharide biosynthesis protein [[Clostridium] sordellii] [Paeniclostridium sordellii]
MGKRIYLSSPHIGKEEYKYIEEAFKTNWISPLGPNVDEFEKEVCKYVGTKSATALISGTSGIHLALKCLGVKQGDIVLCSSLTFSATANPIIYEGARPIFIDSDYETWNMCPIALEKSFKYLEENNTMAKAVIVVNLYGQSADYDKLREICNKYNVPIIEDAAESLGSTYKGKQTGTIGDIGIYSFNGNKIITTSGGGMLVSDNENYTKKALFWATQSKELKRYYEHKELGFNYRMSNIVAGIGRGQMKVLNERILTKQNIFNIYKEAFAQIKDIEMMNLCDFGVSNCWLSVATIKENSKVKPIDIILKLEEENIESRYVWKPMHLQPFFKEYKFFSKLENKSISEDLFNRGICLPSDTKMKEEEINKVINIIKEVFREKEEIKDIYFTKEYGKIYEENKEGRLETYIYESETGKVVYRFLKRKIEMSNEKELFDIITPYGYGGPFLLNYEEKNLDRLVKEFREDFEVYCYKNNIVSEFVRFHPLLENHKGMELYMDIESPRSTICMELKSKDYIWNNLSPKCKNQIRKAVKNGVKIEVGTMDKDLEEFIVMYKNTMMKNSAEKYYYFNKEFFINTKKYLKGDISIFNATYKGEIILSSLIMTYKDYVHYHLTGSKKEFLNLGANNLLLYEISLWAMNKGCKYFHLGGGYSGDEDSLFKFKKGFSKSIKGYKNFYIGKKINLPNEYEKLVKIYEEEKQLSLSNTNFFPAYRL